MVIEYYKVGEQMDKGKIYVCGNSKSPDNSTIGEVYQNFAVELIVDVYTEEIVDASCVLITELGRNYIRSLLVGRKFIKDFDEIIEDIELYYQGAPQKALIVALKVALHRYKQAYPKIIQKNKNKDKAVG